MQTNNIKKLINKLKKRGVISDHCTETLLKLTSQLETPQGKLVTKVARYALAKAIVDKVMEEISKN